MRFTSPAPSRSAADLTAFIAYDHWLSAAASDLGLEVLQPGA
jgi:hypothetical protein